MEEHVDSCCWTVTREGDGWDGVVLIGRRAFVVVVRDGGDQSMSGSGIVGNEERGFFSMQFLRKTVTNYHVSLILLPLYR